MDGYTVDRTYRGVNYHITVDNSAHVQKGVASLIVDGKEMAGDKAIPVPAGKDCYVTVIMG